MARYCRSEAAKGGAVYLCRTSQYRDTLGLFQRPPSKTFRLYRWGVCGYSTTAATTPHRRHGPPQGSKLVGAVALGETPSDQSCSPSDRSDLPAAHGRKEKGGSVGRGECSALRGSCESSSGGRSTCVPPGLMRGTLYIGNRTDLSIGRRRDRQRPRPFARPRRVQ